MSTTSQIQEIYVGLLGRAADAEGLAYWTAEIDGGVLTIEQLRANIVNEQPEWAANLGTLSRTNLVNALYENLFEREPDASGLEYWVNGGGSTVNADQLVLALVNGAAAADTATLSNKTDAATYYTNSGVTYTASTAAAAVSSVDGSLSTLLASKATVNSLAGQAAVSFTTSTSDVLSGTTSSETYTGLISTTASKTTFSDTDIVTDPSKTDSDTLDITVVDDLAASATPTVTNVENIVVKLDATTTAGTAGTFELVTSDFANATTYSVDVIKAVTGVTKLKQTGTTDGSTVVVSDAFVGYSNADADGQDLNIEMQAVGSSGAKVTVDVAETAADIDVDAAGHVDVTASAVTGSVTVTAAKSLEVDALAALVIQATASDGDATIANADAAVVLNATATGDISINDTGAGRVTATAGGTITITETGTNAATSVVLSSVGNSSIASGDAIATATLSGNGAKATYDFATEHAALTEIDVQGSNDVVIKLIPGEIDEKSSNKLILNDNTTAGTVTVELATTSGIVDLSDGDIIDRLELKVDNNDDLITVVDGQTLVVTADQTKLEVAVGKAAAESTNDVTIVLDDETVSAGTAAGTRVDLTAVILTQADTVTIDASQDTSTGGSANPSSISGIDASGPKANVTILGGSNGVTIGGTNTMGTGTLTVTASGAVAFGTSTLTASKLDLSGVSGSITGTTLDLANVADVTLGSGNDTMTFAAGTVGSFTLNTGAGNDTITLPGSADWGNAANAVSLDFGAGDDRLILQNGTKLSKTTGGSVSLSNLETLELAGDASGQSQEIQGSLISGSTIAVEADGAGAAGELVAQVASSDTTLDFSTLAYSEAVSTTVTGMTLTVDASSNTSAIAITGADVMKNTITGGSGADTLTGGTKVDTFVYSSDALLFNSDNAMIDTVVGGAGTDVLQLGLTGAAVEVEADDDFSKLSGVETLKLTTNLLDMDVTLGASAQTAGIVTLDASADASTGDNTLNAAAYTTAITITGGDGADAITGGDGADTITGGAGADTLVGGAGADIFVYAATGDLFTTGSTATDTSINGGDGSDTVQIGTSGTAFLISAADVWSDFSNVEVVKAKANTAAVTVNLDVTAYAAGIRTVDLSAGTAASGNVINAAEITGGGLTLTGSATGVTTITGGDEADIVTGGSLGDTFTLATTAAKGADTIVFGASATLNGSDTLTIDATDKFDFTAFLGDNYSINGTTVGGGTAISATASGGTSDVDITGKVTIVTTATGSQAATATAINTEAEMFALIDGTGDEFSMTEGKAVVIAEAIGSGATAAAETGAGEADYYVYFIDTTSDGATGLSLADVTLVGTASQVLGTYATSLLTTDNFVTS
jgi:hypothetical protein